MKIKLSAIALLFCSSSVFAGFAQLAPPVGWSLASGASATFNAAAAANSATFLNNSVRTSAALNVGGKAITVPVAMRFAANAPRIAAAFAYANPAILIGSAAVLAYAYYQENGFSVVDGQWKKEVKSGGLEYSFGLSWYPTRDAAAEGMASWYMTVNDPGYTYKLKRWTGATTGEFTRYPTSNPASVSTVSFDLLTRASPETIQHVPVSKPEFEETMAPIPLPNGVPQLLPIPLPVELPVINPSLALNPQPLRVPQGLPTPVVPATDPATSKTPVIDVVPANTPDDPFQVDLQPKDIISESFEPLPETSTPPATPDPNATEVPKEDSPGLCELYPDILACAKIGKTEDSTLPKTNSPISVTAKVFAGTGSCPSPLTFSTPVGSHSITFAPICDQLIYLKALMLALAGIMAAYILADSFKVG